MPKAKSFVKQTLKLSKLVAFNKKGIIIPLEDVENYMSELYFHCKEAQNYYISVKFGDDAISREFGTHTTSKQRESFISAYSLCRKIGNLASIIIVIILKNLAESLKHGKSEKKSRIL